MNYTEPYILLLVPAVLILVLFLYAAAARRKKHLLAALLGNNADDPDSLHLSKTARLWKLILYLAGATVIICGIARPYWKKLPLPLKSSGRDIIVLFDVSKSMRATDLPPSRMEQAKFLLREIVNASPGDRFALIAFAGNAFLSCPLTADHTAFNEYINELDTDTVPLGGTNIERALRSADRALKSAESSANAVLMLTDGDALSGNAERLIDDFKSAGIPLIIAGFGDPAVAAPVPDGQGGFIRQNDGSVAASKLNETALAHLAAQTGGVYVRSTVGDTGFATIESALQKLTRHERESGMSYQIDEKFPWFFAAGFILLLFAGVISEAPGKNRRIPNKAKNLILILLLGVSALTHAKEAAPKQPETPPLPENALQLYNLARERQLNGDDSAAALYEEVISKAAGNQDLQNRALHNLGTASHSAGRTLTGKAQQLLSAQQPDAALEQLKGAEAKFNNGKALYDQVLNTEHPVAVSSGSNLRQLELDLQQLQKLKKQIEELKKQQQNARKQTQNALDQQKQQNQQNKSDKQDQQKQQNQQIRQAAQSAAELEKQAAGLKQEKLRQNAADARKELEDAARKQQENPTSKDIQKHLENAAKSLGKPESEPKPQPSEKQGDNQNKKDDKNSAGAENSEEQRRQEKQRNAEQQLQMLDNETAPMRQNLRQRNSRGTPLKKVDKDW